VTTGTVRITHLAVSQAQILLRVLEERLYSALLKIEDGVGIQRTNPEKTSAFHEKIGEIYSDRGGFAGEHKDRLEIDIIPRSSDGKTQIKTTQSYRRTAFSIEQFFAVCNLRHNSLLQSSKLVPEPSQILRFYCPDLANNAQV
jgi:hypothetical protein